MADLRFSKSHEWLRVESGFATVGITRYAAEQLGDVVFVELPDPGKKVAAGGQVAVVESVKAASEIYAPVSGEVTESNATIKDDPAKVNVEPEGAGWFFRMRVSSPGELESLMTKDQYTNYVKTL
jgi:glycine cleavage system H protein